jgi:hypothetical protein
MLNSWSMRPSGDPLFIGDGQTWYHVMLPRDQFELAEHYLRSRAKENLVVIEPDHPLCGFDDRELMDVLVRPDEWSADDSEVAKRLLSERGKPVSEEAVELLREARLDDIRQTAPSQTAFLVLGLISALAGGFLGMAIGWYINTAKKTFTQRRAGLHLSKGGSKASGHDLRSRRGGFCNL